MGGPEREENCPGAGWARGRAAGLAGTAWDPSLNLSTSHPHTWLLARLAKSRTFPKARAGGCLGG